MRIPIEITAYESIPGAVLLRSERKNKDGKVYGVSKAYNSYRSIGDCLKDFECGPMYDLQRKINDAT